ncbi:hypothetical protein R1flu_027266 [Riccia fluitans]|uniref:F-box domain-containing protein n=1 Tax=Riccia fluitans TaxID=41844 RepID=A0ABD1XIA4_9MARC
MEDIDLSSTLWQQLPSEVLDKVLVKLPIAALMSFCRVCKRWRTLILSPDFARRCHSVKPVVFCDFPGGVNYSSRKKIKSFLAIPNTKTNAWEKHKLAFTSEPVDFIAADQGLICFRTSTERLPSLGLHWHGRPVQTDTLFVYNPLTRRSKMLRVPGKPEVEDEDHQSIMLVGLIVDPDTGNYKLVVGFIDEEMEEDKKKTLVYDSQSSTWTSKSVCPVWPVEREDEDDHYWKRWVPGVSVHCKGNLYWLVDENNSNDTFGVRFRFLVKYDVSEDTWTVDEPDLPYERFFEEHDNPEEPPRILPYSRLLKDPSQMYIRLPQINFKPPRWNFHLAVHDGTVFVTLFDSLISRDSFSGEFSSLIPEVRIIDEECVRRFFIIADDVPERYLPTKTVAQGKMWYAAFEHEGVCSESRGRRPLLLFCYNSIDDVAGWLPELELRSSCRRVLPREYPPYLLPRLNTFAASFLAFV